MRLGSTIPTTSRKLFARRFWPPVRHCCTFICTTSRQTAGYPVWWYSRSRTSLCTRGRSGASPPSTSSCAGRVTPTSPCQHCAMPSSRKRLGSRRRSAVWSRYRLHLGDEERPLLVGGFSLLQVYKIQVRLRVLCARLGSNQRPYACEAYALTN